VWAVRSPWQAVARRPASCGAEGGNGENWKLLCEVDRKSVLWAAVAIDRCRAAAICALICLSSSSFDSASRSKRARSSIEWSKVVWLMVVRLAAPTAQTATQFVKMGQGSRTRQG
jgi:hypothetical protein